MNKKCIGCGSVLQDYDSLLEGYTTDINNDLCLRCFRIKNYNEYKVTTRNNDDYIKIINSINSDDLVVYITSLFDIRLDYIDSFKNVIIVLSKRDILPKSVKDYKLVNYIKKRYNNCLDVVVVSSVKNYNLDNLYELIKGYNKNNRVYFIGSTNSGKSTLINKLIKNYGNNDMEITTSLYPSTTLDKIEIDIGDIKFIDTPGLINENSIINYIDNDTLKRINCKKEIKPRTYQLNGNGSFVIDNLVRVDYETINSSMTIYVSNGVSIDFIGKNNDSMLNLCKYKFELGNNRDIVISDLCFIKFTNDINLCLYTYNDVSIYERDNMI